ncbi:hypothetical protein LguiA_002463 [Lonicera macranthoides]
MPRKLPYSSSSTFTVKYATAGTILTEAGQHDCSFIRWSSKPDPSLYASPGHISTPEPFIFGLTSGKTSVSEEPRVNNEDIKLQQLYTGIKGLKCSPVKFSTYPLNILQILQKKPGKLLCSSSSTFTVKYATAGTILIEAGQQDCRVIHWSSKPYPALYASTGHISTPEPFIFCCTSGKNSVSKEPRVNNGDTQFQQLYTGVNGLNCSLVQFSTYPLNFLQILKKKPGKLPWSSSSTFTDFIAQRLFSAPSFVHGDFLVEHPSFKPKPYLSRQNILPPQIRGWEKCWDEGVTPWDLGQPTPIIVHLHRIGALPKGRALVPGCGSGHDVVAIACPECYVVGLDISDSAIKTAIEVRADCVLTLFLVA